MSEVYASLGYGSKPIGFGERIGLVVVDFQKAFTDPRFRMGGGALVNAALERTAELLAVARAKGVPVAQCYVSYPNRNALPYWKIEPVGEDLLEGSEGCELDPRIADPAYDYVFSKPGASAFFMSPLALFLTRNRVDTVCVAGCVTSGCVRATAVDAFQHGFRTMLIDDCSGDQEPGPHADTLRDVGRRYADIVTADDVIRQIMKNAG